MWHRRLRGSRRSVGTCGTAGCSSRLAATSVVGDALAQSVAVVGEVPGDRRPPPVGERNRASVQVAGPDQADGGRRDRVVERGDGDPWDLAGGCASLGERPRHGTPRHRDTQQTVGAGDGSAESDLFISEGTCIAALARPDDHVERGGPRPGVPGLEARDRWPGSSSVGIGSSLSPAAFRRSRVQ